MPTRSRSTRSNFKLSSTSARSPRAATSAMIARTTASTSVEASRLAARRARKRSAKSEARQSRRIGMILSTGPPFGAQWRRSTPGVGSLIDMNRTRRRRPGRPEIGKLDLQALDLEPKHAAAGENEVHDSGGRIGLRKFDGEQVEHGVLAGGIDAAALAAIDPLEPQGRLAASQLRPRPIGREPVEAAERNDQALFLRAPADIGDLDE